MRRTLRTKFMNFSLDWDWSREPLASIVRVKRVDAKSYDLEFIDYTDFPSKTASLTVLSAYDPKTRSVGIEDGITRYLDMNKQPKDWAQVARWVDLAVAEGVDRLAAWTYRGGYGTVVGAPDALKLWDTIGENYKRVISR